MKTMAIKRISFIESKSPGNHIFSKFPIPRLGAILLSTILKQRGYEVRAFVEDIADPDWSYIENSDLVCISAITGTALRSYRIAERMKKQGIPVVLGGAHPSFQPDEALGYADFVVRGEGEETLVELMGCLEKGTPSLESIAGLSFHDKDGRAVHNPGRPFIMDLDALPEPDFSVVHNWKPTNIFPVSTSRGCPFDCRFCSVIHMFGRKYRFKHLEAVMEELRHLPAVSQGSKFFVDDNFTANKARTKELLRAMIAEKFNYCWSAQVRTDVARDEELLGLLADAGCETVQIGFESVNPKTLEAFNKKQNLDEIVESIRKVHDYGIKIHGMFVFGSDLDTVDTIKQTADFAIKHRIDTIQFMMLTPLPGTPFFTEMKDSDRLLHTQWDKYDAHHVVYKPLLMTPQALHMESLKAMGRFYSWKYIFDHAAKLDFFYAAVGLYGKQAVRKALKEARGYLDSIGALVESPLPDPPPTTS
jgi:radical SAM superfamily enzyme YgiQ (UPF0313 family)